MHKIYRSVSISQNTGTVVLQFHLAVTRRQPSNCNSQQQLYILRYSSTWWSSPLWVRGQLVRLVWSKWRNSFSHVVERPATQNHWIIDLKMSGICQITYKNMQSKLSSRLSNFGQFTILPDCSWSYNLDHALPLTRNKKFGLQYPRDQFQDHSFRRYWWTKLDMHRLPWSWRTQQKSCICSDLAGLAADQGLTKFDHLFAKFGMTK